jgi:hypothetical protein
MLLAAMKSDNFTGLPSGVFSVKSINFFPTDADPQNAGWGAGSRRCRAGGSSKALGYTRFVVTI